MTTPLLPKTYNGQPIIKISQYPNYDLYEEGCLKIDRAENIYMIPVMFFPLALCMAAYPNLNRVNNCPNLEKEDNNLIKTYYNAASYIGISFNLLFLIAGCYIKYKSRIDKPTLTDKDKEYQYRQTTRCQTDTFLMVNFISLIFNISVLVSANLKCD